MTPPAVAELQGVSFGYPRQPTVLSRVDVRIDAGDLLGVVGPNGSGKTTLLKLLLGLLEPTQGTVTVLGDTPLRARQRIGYVPQHAVIDPAVPASALDIVLLGRLRRSSWGPVYGRRQRAAALAALERAQAAHLAHRPLRTLSGGERQRVLIARALACDAELLLLDEPTTGVDAHAEEGLMDLLAQLNRELTVVLVSHDVLLVSSRLRRVACVGGGRVSIHPVRDLTPQRLAELYSQPLAVVEHGATEPGFR